MYEVLRVPLEYRWPFDGKVEKDENVPYLKIHPPEGEAWQLWYYLNGPPVSPTFERRRQLVDWMVEQGWEREVADQAQVGNLLPKRERGPTLTPQGSMRIGLNAEHVNKTRERLRRVRKGHRNGGA
jgi:hypothetical protein